MSNRERNRLGRELYEHMRRTLTALDLPPWERAPGVTRDIWADAAAVVARAAQSSGPGR